MFGKGGLGDLMKQAQQMQSRMAEAQSQLEDSRHEGSAGGGMVKVILSGKHDLISLSINPEVVNADDVPMLEDLVKAAFTQARNSASAMQKELMHSVTGGLPIPGLTL